MGLLVLVRHGQSEWNSKRIFSGQSNPKLTAQGVEEAKRTGQLLKSKSLKFDMAYSSCLARARNTLGLILTEMEQSQLHVIEDKRFNERDYGELTGLTVEAASQNYGVEQVHRWRQSFDEVPPGGESLEMTAKRTSNAFNSCVLP
ncbi:2,3-bisphosphoglycerate-dependent phosphoglycerate mutase [Pseudovibrio sp. Tun.PSC04-5.I4]|uniref:2,3-bisphosphoglycerate-dependent phosphoglycerate mutase n=1 Tax=Pseudovibrio sp. Tun.PSC04-5.I4 TaxID=1798213 RepID=UPI001AD94E89|nr:2,3-bisphosphoglycerate-dependent phosphoglycerate mutase [Pseudovibrio sp. Tun.PSC04-5.I4]